MCIRVGKTRTGLPLRVAEAFSEPVIIIFSKSRFKWFSRKNGIFNKSHSYFTNLDTHESKIVTEIIFKQLGL